MSLNVNGGAVRASLTREPGRAGVAERRHPRDRRLFLPRD
jgi:hypothetical protein